MSVEGKRLVLISILVIFERRKAEVSETVFNITIGFVEEQRFVFFPFVFSGTKQRVWVLFSIALL